MPRAAGPGGLIAGRLGYWGRRFGGGGHGGLRLHRQRSPLAPNGLFRPTRRVRSVTARRQPASCHLTARELPTPARELPLPAREFAIPQRQACSRTSLSAEPSSSSRARRRRVLGATRGVCAGLGVRER